MIVVPVLWLVLFFLVPFLIVLKISYAVSDPSVRPPYSALISFATQDTLAITLSLRNYIMLLADPLYVGAFLRSLLFAGVSTGVALLIGYPIAYGIARARPFPRLVLLTLVILPFWTSSLLRSYALIGILKTNGVLNQALQGLGIIDAPLEILHTNLAVYIGIVYNYLPFMILPLTANLMKLDFTLLEAAADLGATPWVAFWKVTVPLSKAGIIAGAMLVFIPCIGEFVIPELLGGPQTLMIGRVLWDEFFSNNDWPMAGSVAVVMVLLIIVPLAIFNKYQAEAQETRR